MLAFVVYLLVVGVLWKVLRVDYTKIASSPSSLVRGLVVPIGAGLLVLVAATTVLGWWPEVLTQDRIGPAWMLAVPALFLVIGVIGAATVDYRALGGRRTALLVLGTALVGAAEELLARGLLVVAAQEAGWDLVWVWLFSAALFSALHAINALVGMPVKAMLVQLVASFVGGTAFFVTLLTTGSLLAGVVIHALWDFASLAHLGAGSKPPVAATAGLGVVYLGGIAALVVLLVA